MGNYKRIRNDYHLFMYVKCIVRSFSNHLSIFQCYPQFKYTGCVPNTYLTTFLFPQRYDFFYDYIIKEIFKFSI